MARLGPILGRISPPPWGAPGRLQEVIFRLFWDVPAEILKISICLSFVSHIWGLFSMLLFALCCLPCSVAGGVVHMQNIENSLVFVGRKPYAPCSGNARSNQLSGGTHNKYRWKISSKKGPTGPENKVKKRAFLRPKWLPKWTPEASRNVCTRRSATEAAKNASWGAPRAPPDDFGAILVPHR